VSADKKSERLEFLQDSEEYKRVAESQRTWCRRLADRFESDQPLVLEPVEREFVAGLLRFWAEQTPDAPKGKQGPPPKFDAASEALVYAMARLDGRRHGEVVDEISDRVNASRVAVEKGIKKWRAQAFARLGRADPGNQ
jgi:hypothetical protein